MKVQAVNLSVADDASQVLDISIRGFHLRAEVQDDTATRRASSGTCFGHCVFRDQNPHARHLSLLFLYPRKFSTKSLIPRILNGLTVRITVGYFRQGCLSCQQASGIAQVPTQLLASY